MLHFVYDFIHSWTVGYLSILPCIYREQCFFFFHYVCTNTGSRPWFQLLSVCTRIASSYVKSRLNFLRNTPTTSCSIVFHSYQQYIKIPVSLYSWQHLIFLFLIVIIITSAKWPFIDSFIHLLIHSSHWIYQIISKHYFVKNQNKERQFLSARSLVLYLWSKDNNT